MHNSIVVHYSEIGTKGANRNYFENHLMNNIRKATGLRVYKRYGRIICELKGSQKHAREILEFIPGIAYFSFASKTKLGMKHIMKTSLDILKNGRFVSFKVKTTRSNKKFPLTSMEVDKQVGKLICSKLNKGVNVKRPGKTLFIEIGEKEAYIYCKKHKGIGGLPVGTEGKIIASLSGGIDSPVASFLMMKRGCKIIFVHFCGRTTEKSLAKIEEIVKQLSKIQHRSKLYIVPFDKIQDEIIKKIQSKSRMIIYRRFMTKIINEIAKKEKALAIATGDSIGQVASQTMKNLNCIYGSSGIPILTPLIGMNKEEIINIAKQVGTYKYSILPYPDCCSYMIAKHPETRAELKDILKSERKIKNQNKLVRDAVKGADTRKI